MSEEYRIQWCPVCQERTAHEDGQCIDECHKEENGENDHRNYRKKKSREGHGSRVH